MIVSNKHYEPLKNITTLTVLVYSVDTLLLRQAYPVRHSPYEIVGSRKLAWASRIASNIVIGYDLITRIHVEKVVLSNRAATQLTSFRRSVGHVVCGVGAGYGSSNHWPCGR